MGSLGLAGETELWCEVDRTEAPRGRVLDAGAEEIAELGAQCFLHPEGNCMPFSLGGAWNETLQNPREC